MKYAIIIPDGCADEPQASLGGKTPLQAARTPNMDRIASTGVVGLSNNVPASLTPASDVATLSLFGYDPLVVYTGRAPLETAAMGIALGANDWARAQSASSGDGGTVYWVTLAAFGLLVAVTALTVSRTREGRLWSSQRRRPAEASG